MSLARSTFYTTAKMEFSTMSSAELFQLTAPNHILEADDQQSYFPPRWSNRPIHVDFGLDDPQGDLFPMQGQPVKDPASSVHSSNSSIVSGSSPCSSESSRRNSQDGLPSQVGRSPSFSRGSVNEGANGLKKQDRRRAQNRAAQRAYRERKEQTRQELEGQVKEWQDKHQLLREFYVDQAQEVQRLRGTVEMLQTQLLALRDTQLANNTSLFDFDMWPDVEWKAA